MTNIFLAYLLTGLIGTLSACVLFFMKPLTKKCFSASWHYYVWLVVLIIMLVPLRVDVNSFTFKDNEVVHLSTEELSESAAIAVTENNNAEQNAPLTFDGFSHALEKNLHLFAYVWLFIAAAVFVQKAVRYRFFIKNVLKNSYPINLDEAGENIEVRIMDKAESPFVIRSINPILVLPDKSLTACQMKNVLAHEIMHIKRKDILYKWLVTACKAVHWFNPFMYLIAREIDKACEISCDEAVAKSMNKNEKKSYAETIMSFAFEKGTMPLTTSIATSKKVLRNRLVAIKNSKRGSKIKGAFSALVVLLFLMVFSMVSAFAGGLLLPLYGNKAPTLYFDDEQALYGYKDNEGNVVIEPQYLKAGDFYEDAALVILPENPKVLRFIKPDGTYLFEKEFSAVNNFNSGYALAVANDNGEYSYINKKGEWATDLLFEAAENFCAGFALVQTDDKWGVVDTNFNFKVPCKYDNKDEALEKLNLN
ncbi:MAG: WG repeat-containing protein [Clostridia bacterium]|nr:WG repeat-containing protein [Clostridia bacterium]